MGYHNPGNTPIQDVITSAVTGSILGLSLFVIAEATGIMDVTFRALDLSDVGRRIGVVQFVIVGAILGTVSDLIGKLTRLRPGARS